MRWFRALPLVAAALFVPLPALGGHATVDHPPFTLTIPDDFALRMPTGDLLLAYYRAGRTEEQSGTFILVRQFHKLAHRQSPSPKSLRGDFVEGLGPKSQGREASVELAPWRGNDIAVVRQSVKLEGHPAVSFTAVVPLAPEAITLQVVGDEGDAASSRALLGQLLDGLDGKVGFAKDPPLALVETVGDVAERLVLFGFVVAAGVLVIRGARGRNGARAAAPSR